VGRKARKNTAKDRRTKKGALQKGGKNGKKFELVVEHKRGPEKSLNTGWAKARKTRCKERKRPGEKKNEKTEQAQKKRRGQENCAAAKVRRRAKTN